MEQYDLLCESRQRLGFVGACYFIGVIIASSAIPVGWLSDKYGRKWIFVLSIIPEILACYWLIIGSQLYVLYTCLIILGMGHPGRNIVGLSYADEFLHRRQQKYLIPMNQLVAGTTVILTAFYYQNLSRDINYIQYAHLGVIIILCLVTIVYLPESPKYLHAQGRYDETRQSLATVAYINGIQNFPKDQIVFETEKLQMQRQTNQNNQQNDQEEAESE